MIGNLGAGFLFADPTAPAAPAESPPTATQLRSPKLRPKYVESWFVFAVRRLFGAVLLSGSAIVGVLAAALYFDARPDKTTAVVLGVGSFVAATVGLWLLRGRRKDRSPMATESQLARILELHGSLPRQVTESEANDVITFLERHKMDCPFCGAKCKAENVVCGGCRKRLEAVRVPISLGNG